MSAMTASMQGLKQAAESGSFAISQSGAEAYLKTIGDAQRDLQKLDRNIFVLANETQLGTSPDGQAMARYNAESANGGGGTTGIVPALNQLKAALEEARLAVQKAVENYREVDDSKANTFQRH